MAGLQHVAQFHIRGDSGAVLEEMMPLEQAEPSVRRGLERPLVQLLRDVRRGELDHVVSRVVERRGSQALAVGWTGEVGVVAHSDEVGVVLESPIDVVFQVVKGRRTTFPGVLNIADGKHHHLFTLRYLDSSGSKLHIDLPSFGTRGTTSYCTKLGN